MPLDDGTSTSPAHRAETPLGAVSGSDRDDREGQHGPHDRLLIGAEELGDHGAEQAVAAVIAKHRDWRIDTIDPTSSVAFASVSRRGGQIAPLSSAGKGGRLIAEAFGLLAKGISDWQKQDRAAVLGRGLRRASDYDEPPSFAMTVLGVRCRVQRITSRRFHVRVTSNLIELDRTGMPRALRAKLLDSSLSEGGLVVVSGGYGSGKSSTVNAAIRARIERWGGYALAMGSPIEYEFSGFHGTQDRPGYVEQVDLVGLDLEQAIQSTMRNFPSGATSILGYPELVSHRGTAEMLRHANRGNLVFADMHALNAVGCILNLVSMAESDGEGNARQQLANSLKLIIHQSTAPDSGAASGMRVAFESIEVTSNMRAALIDRAIPLARALDTMDRR